MAKTLRGIDPQQAVPSRPRVLIEGRGGVGKTWGSLEFPSVYYIDTEGGANRKHYRDKLTKAGGKYFGPEQGSQDFETVLEEIITLATVQHDHRTLVIDSYSKLEGIKVNQVNDAMVKDGKSVEFNADKKGAYKFSRRLISWIDRLDMNVILICHEKDKWQNGKVVGQTFDGFDKLEYELDLCLRIVKNDDDDRRAIVMKTRLEEFPDGSSFPWSYKEFSKRYGKDAIEANASPIEMATPDQVGRLTTLLELLKVPDDTSGKWLDKARVERFEDMDTATIGKCIAYLEAKIPKIGNDNPKLPKAAAKPKEI